MTMNQATRAYVPHRPSWQRFHEHAAPLASSSGAGSAAAANASGQDQPYARQYSHVYADRLARLRERCGARCLAAAQQSAPKDGESKEDVSVAERIIDVKEGDLTMLIGTLVKEMDPKRRPAVSRLSSSSHDAALTHDAQSFLFPTNGERSKNHQEPLRSHLFDSGKGDVLHLEDESGRVELAPMEDTSAVDAMDVDTPSSKHRSHKFDPNSVATGMVAAVVGRVCATSGVLRVQSISFAGPPPDPKTPTDDGDLTFRGPTVNGEEATNGGGVGIEPVLLLVSGLGCGADAPGDHATGASLALRREMLLDYLTDDAPLGGGAAVCRVIVAGGGVSSSTEAAAAEEGADEGDDTGKGGGSLSYNSIAKSNVSKRASSSTAAANHVVFALRELDLYLAEMLGSGIPVDYVPGWHDQTNANWPQRPIHSCLMPLSCQYVDLFGRSTNPYEGILGREGEGGDGDKETAEDGGRGFRVLGTDGLNVADLRRYLVHKTSETMKEGDEGDGDGGTCSASCMDALNQTLNCGHMAPTGPDSLPTVPSSTDPFVLQHRPSVYFAGNCDKFETRLVDGNGDEIAENNTAAHGNSVTRLVCVPSFALTGEVVLVKLRSLQCEVLSFNDATILME